MPDLNDVADDARFPRERDWLNGYFREGPGDGAGEAELPVRRRQEEGRPAREVY